MKKYLEFTVNKEPENIKNIFAHEPTAIWKILLLKNNAKLVINGKTRTYFTFLKTLRWRLCYRSLSQNDLNCFKNRLELCGFADRKFFYISNLERFFSSLKKTIVLYLLKARYAFLSCTHFAISYFLSRSVATLSLTRLIYLVLFIELDFNNFKALLLEIQ